MTNTKESLTSFVGRKMEELRMSRKMSRKALSERLELSENQIFLYENGKASPNLEMIERWAAALEIEPMDLFPKPKADFFELMNEFQSWIDAKRAYKAEVLAKHEELKKKKLRNGDSS